MSFLWFGASYHAADPFFHTRSSSVELSNDASWGEQSSNPSSPALLRHSHARILAPLESVLVSKKADERCDSSLCALLEDWLCPKLRRLDGSDDPLLNHRTNRTEGSRASCCTTSSLQRHFEYQGSPTLQYVLLTKKHNLCRLWLLRRLGCWRPALDLKSRFWLFFSSSTTRQLQKQARGCKSWPTRFVVGLFLTGFDNRMSILVQHFVNDPFVWLLERFLRAKISLF